METWDDKYEHLRDSTGLHHNTDYLQFLVREVWQLNKPCRLADFGCGYGRMGMILMPMLLPGSTYTGIDASKPLLAKGESLLAGAPYEAVFIHADAAHVPLAADTFDVAFSHTVLMHLSDPGSAIAEMIRVTRDGGLVIACEANRNAHNAMLHIHESNELDSAPLELFQTMNRHVRQTTGVDCNIGARMPILLHQAGLRNVQARVSDAVRLCFPPLDTEGKRAMFGTICDQGLGYQPTDPQEVRQWAERLVAAGIPLDQAQREIHRELSRDFAGKGHAYHTVYPGLLMFSFGTVKKPCGTEVQA